MSLFKLPQVYYSKGAGAGYVNGIWTEAKTVAGTFLGTIQPLNANEVRNLPEGERNIGSVKIYSETKLNVAQEASSPTESGDVVVFQDRYYWVKYQNPYKSGLIEHYKYIAHYWKEVIVGDGMAGGTPEGD